MKMMTKISTLIALVSILGFGSSHLRAVAFDAPCPPPCERTCAISILPVDTCNDNGTLKNVHDALGSCAPTCTL